MFKDHEFDPVTPEEEARRRQEEEFARRVRREVLRIERGEADEDIRADTFILRTFAFTSKRYRSSISITNEFNVATASAGSVTIGFSAFGSFAR